MSGSTAATQANDRIVIVGAGQAGARAAEALRGAGHAGSIVLIGEEPTLPYERPQLSKEFLLRPEAEVALIRDAVAWSALDVQLHIGAGVAECELERRRVSLADGRAYAFDRLLLTTGTRARRLPDLEEGALPVRTLRTVEDAIWLRKAFVPGASVVMIGGGVIGLETAAAAIAAGCAVTVLEAAPTLLSRALPRAAAAFLLRRHQGEGVAFRFGVVAERVEQDGVVLSDGSRVAADLVVVGVGAEPNVELAAQIGLDAVGGVKVDAYGRTEAPGVFAAGDVASQWNEQRKCWARVETWANAQNQAIAVGRTLAGDAAPYLDPPWFWSDQYDANLQVVGDMAMGDLVARGDVLGDRFTLIALDGEIVRGAVTINRRPDMAALRKLVALSRPIARAELENTAFDLRKAVK
jgi:NADPH-dependent 2,4-dienoyl-CoA reductase/sulfur reductase-like enzyme